MLSLKSPGMKSMWNLLSALCVFTLPDVKAARAFGMGSTALCPDGRAKPGAAQAAVRCACPRSIPACVLNLSRISLRLADSV
ncbi:hypothetical protein NB716_000527 [Pantoea ananatis]|nr:hypothetical protein [Pantoea ananatis]